MKSRSDVRAKAEFSGVAAFAVASTLLTVGACHLEGGAWEDDWDEGPEWESADWGGGPRPGAACENDRSCGPACYCDRGDRTCVPSSTCLRNEHCPAGMACDERNTCVPVPPAERPRPQCTSNAMCPTDQICVNATCRTPCAADCDCGSGTTGTVCTNGFCTTPEEGATCEGTRGCIADSRGNASRRAEA